MDLTALGATIFASVPAGMKGTVTFRRKVAGVFDPILDRATGESYTTWTAECVYVSPKGTGTESFVDMLAVRSKYVRLIVKASGAIAPQTGDEATIASGDVLSVVGVDPTRPDGINAAIYTVDAERIS